MGYLLSAVLTIIGIVMIVVSLLFGNRKGLTGVNLGFLVIGAIITVLGLVSFGFHRTTDEIYYPAKVATRMAAATDSNVSVVKGEISKEGEIAFIFTRGKCSFRTVRPDRERPDFLGVEGSSSSFKDDSPAFDEVIEAKFKILGCGHGED